MIHHQGNYQYRRSIRLHCLSQWGRFPIHHLANHRSAWEGQENHYRLKNRRSGWGVVAFHRLGELASPRSAGEAFRRSAEDLKNSVPCNRN